MSEPIQLLCGAAGAIAPEIVRWFRIARTGAPILDWGRRHYWLATGGYVALGALVAALLAREVAYAAFLAGLSTEFTILGALKTRPPSDEAPPEELAARDASIWVRARAVLRDHASYLIA